MALRGSAGKIVEWHDENATSFSPMGQLLELDAKVILVGYVDTRLKLSSVRLADEKLVLASGSVARSLQAQRVYRYVFRHS